MRRDPHSYSDDAQARTKSLRLHLVPDFQAKTLRSEVELRFERPATGALDLDTRGLRIESVTALDGAALRWQLAEGEPILGARLRIELPSQESGVRIVSVAAPDASALQWLPGPFLFTQCQPIHARSLFPLQDTPRVRVTIERAQIDAPPGLRALMAAAQLEPGIFAMPQPIPPYLIAFAVGDLVERPISRRCSIWASPAQADAAAWELAQLEETLAVAEQLFGPYDWERADLLVMPPSFPYGGMENPRLTFLTPSLIAGDRSLVNVVAHELAHAWTGNLVTNADAQHFWLNEGFTVYAERRILEAQHGRALSELHAAIGAHELAEALERFKPRPELTRLRTQLLGVDPDEAYSQIPYEKGYLFLRRLEELAGRAAWDRFLRAYLAEFRFQSIETDDFLRSLEAHLPGLAQRADALAWIDGPRLPPDAPRPQSARLDELKSALSAPEGLSPTELLIWMQHARPSPEELARVRSMYALRSLELRVQFALLAIAAGIPSEAAALVGETGRMKYLRPLYAALPRDEARPLFAQHRSAYHPIAREVIEGILRA